ncbi:MAG: hypothetical protein F6K21_05625 [Symploca sp. SIO2D2]|nr:hypothetical protein [Symploca sp. SIO2D2]
MSEAKELQVINPEGVIHFEGDFAEFKSGEAAKVSIVMKHLSEEMRSPKCSVLVPGGQWKTGTLKIMLAIEEETTDEQT